MSRCFTVIDTTGRSEHSSRSLKQLDGLDVHLAGVKATSPEEVIAACGEADVVLVTAARITREVLDALPNLRGVVRYGVGLDNIDLAAAAEKGVHVRNTRNFCTEEMADHALALLLACTRDIVPMARDVRCGTWGRTGTRPLRRLAGGVAGVIGLGAIGSAVARRLQALGMTVWAFDPYAPPQQAQEQGVRLVQLEEMLPAADVISIHCALTDETRHLLGAAQFALMKPSAVLVNTSRGGVLDEAALADVLRSGTIAAAGLDVLEKEPPDSDNPLLCMENVVITPHIAWYSEEAKADLAVNTFRQLAEVLRLLEHE